MQPQMAYGAQQMMMQPQRMAPQMQAPQQRAPPPQAAAPAPAGPSGVDPARLALMTQEQQKNLLGEKLFSRITEQEPNNAAKITGMLLEMDNAEIINLLDSPQLLNNKVQEAVTVLREHAMN